jgi:hypothetical protein
MPARTKRRARFDFHGREFVWWIDGDHWLRIASLDKRFVVAVPLLRDSDQSHLLAVHGQEFPGLTPADSRPVYLVVPQPSGSSMGAWVDQILRWSFDTSHQLVHAEGPVQFF